MEFETKIFALREHNQGKTKDYIAIRTPDKIFYVNLEKEKVEAALHQFETGLEINVNY